VPIAREAGEEYVPATAERAIDGAYPLARFLYVYINKEPGQRLPQLTLEFLKLVLAQQGQQVVVKDGYIPLPGSVAQRELAKLQ
jgi:phosphate transport system substrate-binding protein